MYIVLKPFSGRFLSFTVCRVFWKPWPYDTFLINDLHHWPPWVSRRNKENGGKRGVKELNLSTPQTNTKYYGRWEEWRTRGSPSSTSQLKTTAHIQPHLVTVYLVSTWTKLHLRHRGKIKAIYTDNIVD